MATGGQWQGTEFRHHTNDGEPVPERYPLPSRRPYTAPGRGRSTAIATSGAPSRTHANLGSTNRSLAGWATQ